MPPMPLEAGALMFGSLAAAGFFLYLLNRYFPNRTSMLDEEGMVRAEYKKSDTPPPEWDGRTTGWEG